MRHATNGAVGCNGGCDPHAPCDERAAFCIDCGVATTPPLFRCGRCADARGAQRNAANAARKLARALGIAAVATALLLPTTTSAHPGSHDAEHFNPERRGTHATRIRDDATRWRIYERHPERFRCFAPYVLVEDLTCVGPAFHGASVAPTTFGDVVTPTNALAAFGVGGALGAIARFVRARRNAR
jgi:hypothetical protein